jgi:hypothetical protein
MFTWRTIRATCIVLLLAPVAHLVYLVSADVMATLDPSPTAWAAEVEAYGREDRASQLPDHPIVVVGGMRVKLWQDLPDLLAPKAVLMRGLGDATIDDILYYHKQLIGYYQPQSVIFLPGISEFHIRDGKSAEELVAGIQKLVALDDSHEINRQYYVVTPLKTPLYPGDDAIIDQVAAQLDAWATRKPQVTVLDANHLLLGQDGRPQPAYYRADGVNLNEHGYLRLSTLVQNEVEDLSCCNRGASLSR